jgi:DHA2 family multidrug resistance protein
MSQTEALENTAKIGEQVLPTEFGHDNRMAEWTGEPTVLSQNGHQNPPEGPWAARAEEANFRYRWVILIGLILAAIMEVLDTTIINVALPQMAGNLGTTTQEIAWVSTAYILANVIVLPMTAFLNARFGRRAYLAGSVIIFTITSFLCGTSQGLGEIVVWRILQGAAGAALISTAQATLVQIFPPREQAVVQPLFLMGLVVAPTIGPTLGGFITDAAHWSWCFFINIPVGALAAVLVLMLLRDTEATRAGEPVDWLGVGLLAVGLGSLQYVLQEGQTNDWFADPLITQLTVLSVITLLALVFWQLSPRNTHPVVDFRVLKNPSLTGGIVLFIGAGMGLYGVTYLYPLLAQVVHGFSALQTGLALLPGGVATAVGVVFCGVVSSNPKTPVDARLLTLIGIVLSVTAMWQLAHLSPDSGVGDTFWPLLLRGFSIGFLIVPVNQLAIASLAPAEVTQGTGLLGLARQLGGSIGVAILATALDTSANVNRANLIGYLTPDSDAFNDRLAGLTRGLIGQGYGASDAHQAALSILDQTLTHQALTMAFNDTFYLLVFLSVITAPILFLIRKPKAGATVSPIH